MKTTIRIKRFDPAKGKEPWYQEYPLDAPEDYVILSALHDIHDRQDGTLAYRYSCRGAICGSCAMKINSVAALACKTQIKAAAKEGGVITLEPLLNMPVIKDLVVEQEPFFKELRGTHYHLISDHERKLDEPLDVRSDMSDMELDQWNRSSDCIKCQACFSDCPKRSEDANFIGPEACIDIYRYYFDARDEAHDRRMDEATQSGGIWDCDKHGNCVKVCPKDCRPMRAIMLLRKRAEKSKT